ncbi:Y-family DNA polymerase [Daejeonella oryzae]|uniref:Y-family DNA polymerase n=1 Tax=Daejeonella oryzae TaxID=1122943 RepID=UPI00041B8B43|nr:Y-family DNA polymerase [Daejeonella oryzae]
MYALIDCNNFYASCERVFRPALRTKPVIILSNNDGCAIARSQEAKDLGIKMGTPFYQMETLIKEHEVSVFSSNYTLYADMSARVMNNIARFTPDVEVYSIDECFIKLNGMNDLETYAGKIRETVIRNTGIPISIGIAPSKTLAKIANKLAKKGSGIFILDTPERITEALQTFPLKDVWGIGAQYHKKLLNQGIEFAEQLRQMPMEWVRTNMTIQGVRMWDELWGRARIPFGAYPERKKGICCSRSFGKLSGDLSEISEAACSYASRVAEKLRNDKSCATLISVRLITNQYRTDLPQYFEGITIPLNHPSSNTPEIVKAAIKALKLIYKPGYKFLKVEILVTGIIPENEVQLNLFSTFDGTRQNQVSELMDKLNKHYGSGTLRLATEGYKKAWAMRREHLSPSYTTRWNDILKVI